MTEDLQRHRGSFRKPPALSLDSWAVIVALVFSAAIWFGVIKHVPW
ncbi:MAG: hypothetical protein WCA38_02555 [Candidatus Acidiferrales bacterium]